MDKLLSLLVDKLPELVKRPKFYLWLIIIGAIAFFAIPFIYANFFFHTRMLNRVEILSRLSELDIEVISGNEILLNEYNAILQELSHQHARVVSIGGYNIIGSIIVEDEPIYRLKKFISGGTLSWIIMLFVPLMKTFKSRSEQITAFFLLLIIGMLAGLLGRVIPTFYNIWVNLIGFPVLQMLLIGIVALRMDKKEKV